MKQGLITGIDRATNTVLALMFPFYAVDKADDERPNQIRAGYRGDPPPPFCPATFSDDLKQCLGSVSPAVRVLHEDFLLGTYTAGTPPYGSLAGDTPWTVDTLGGTITVGSVATASGRGVVEMRVTSTAQYDGVAMLKGQGLNTLLLSSADGWWLSARVLVGGLTTGKPTIQFNLGRNSGNATCGAAVAPVFTGNNNWWLGGSPNLPNQFAQVDGGAEALNDMWYEVEVFFVPGGFAALWVDGRLCCTIDERGQLPDPADIVQPLFYLQRADVGGTGNIYVQIDRFDLYAVANRGIPHPSVVPV